MRLSEEQRAFYERLVVTGRWSSRELDKQINLLDNEDALKRRLAQLSATYDEAQLTDVDGGGNLP